MLLGDLLDDGQAQPRAGRAPGGGGAVEALEDVGQVDRASGGGGPSFVIGGDSGGPGGRVIVGPGAGVIVGPGDGEAPETGTDDSSGGG